MLLDEHFFALQMFGHGQAEREALLYGGGMHYRFLNVTGRWSARGTRTVPLLAWKDLDLAQEAAVKASTARKKTIKATSVVHGPEADGSVIIFTATQANALLGYLPYTATAASKLEEDRLKTMHYAIALLSVIRAKDSDREEASKTSSKNLHSMFGGGSVTSAALFFSGKKAERIFEGLVTGELQCSEDLEIKDIAEALAYSHIYLNS